MEKFSKNRKTGITTEELFKKYSNSYQFEEGDVLYFIDEEDFLLAVKEFAKICCDEQKDLCSENLRIFAAESDTDYIYARNTINKAPYPKQLQ